VLIFDGLFLLRPQPLGYWDLTIHLVAEERRDSAWQHYLYDDLPHEEAARIAETEERLTKARWPRYRDGWALYQNDADPRRTANIVIDNDDLANPNIVQNR
jgi:hypothetical protein